MIETIANFLFPKFCVGCGKYGVSICSKCRNELAISEQICPACGNSSPMGWTHERCKEQWGMDGLIAIYDYQDDLVKKAIEEIKFGFNRELVWEILRNFSFESGEKFDCLVPVPLHYYRENWRGFNQAEEIAKVIGERLGIDVSKILQRKRKTKQQSLIADRREREKNVKGAFGVVKGASLKGKKVLLVDDIFTSGADMRECTKILKKAGVDTVWGLALGH